MDIIKLIKELRGELQHVEQAILAFEQVAEGGGAKRRGRPPKWLVEARKQEAVPPVSKRKTARASSKATA